MKRYVACRSHKYLDVRREVVYQYLVGARLKLIAVQTKRDLLVKMRVRCRPPKCVTHLVRYRPLFYPQSLLVKCETDPVVKVYYCKL